LDKFIFAHTQSMDKPPNFIDKQMES